MPLELNKVRPVGCARDPHNDHGTIGEAINADESHRNPWCNAVSDHAVDTQQFRIRVYRAHAPSLIGHSRLLVAAVPTLHNPKNQVASTAVGEGGNIGQKLLPLSRGCPR